MLSNFFRYMAVENFVEKLEMASGLLEEARLGSPAGLGPSN